MVNRELLMEQANREIPSILIQWKERLLTEVSNELNELNELDPLLAHKIVDFIEKNGCSIETAIQAVLYPQEFITFKEEIYLKHENNYEK